MTTPQPGEIWRYHLRFNGEYIPEEVETWVIIESFKVSERITAALCYTGFCLESGEIDNFFYGERTAPHWMKLA